MRSAASTLAVAHDPTIYPVKDDRGVGTLERAISEVLRVLLERYLVERGEPTFVGANQLFYWKQFDPSEGIAPDVYVLPGAPLHPLIDTWKVWETGLVPSFAFEVVSTDVDGDYLRAPQKYARLGVEELVVFDPDHGNDPGRARFQVFRRSKRGLLCVERTNADRVRSKVLGCHLRAVGDAGALRVRVATGINGETLFPTDAEARARADDATRAARARTEAALARAKAINSARATSEAPEAQLKAANAEIEAPMAVLTAEREARAQLERELAQLRGAARKKRSG